MQGRGEGGPASAGQAGAGAGRGPCRGRGEGGPASQRGPPPARPAARCCQDGALDNTHAYEALDNTGTVHIKHSLHNKDTAYKALDNAVSQTLLGMSSTACPAQSVRLT